MSKKEISYSEAISEIETILSQLEKGELDVDKLADKVKRVSELIRICRNKIHLTEKSVNEILQDDNKENPDGEPEN